MKKLIFKIRAERDWNVELGQRGGGPSCAGQVCPRLITGMAIPLIHLWYDPILNHPRIARLDNSAAPIIARRWDLMLLNLLGSIGRREAL